MKERYLGKTIKEWTSDLGCSRDRIYAIKKRKKCSLGEAVEMIRSGSGEKKEEYRALSPYYATWFKRFLGLELTPASQVQVESALRAAGGEVARYKSREQCTYVLEMLMSAIDADERTFTFPAEKELEHAKQHGATGGGKRHGSS